MSCNNPLQAWKGKPKSDGKIAIVWKKKQSWKGDELLLPCGRCAGCRLEKSRQWAMRCVHEASLYDENCFLTLTYNEENLPLDGSLVKGEFKLFVRRLAHEIGYFPRYYHAGEYGDDLGRPHYHALLFNPVEWCIWQQCSC